MAREYPTDQAAGWRQWSTTTLWLGLLVTAAVGLVAVGWEPLASPRFLVGVGSGLLGVCAVVGWVVTRATDRTITLASKLTLGRGAAIAVFAGFLTSDPVGGPAAWLPAMLFALAAGLDAVDGAIARATDSVSELGGRLDTEIDSLTVLVGTLYVVSADLVPTVFLLVGLARYAFVFGIRRRQRRGLPIKPLPPSQLRRVLGGVAMATIWVALLPAVEPAVSRLVAAAVLVPFLANFSRDWLAVSGRR